MNHKIAICVVGYNRLESIQRNLESLIRAYYPSGENVHLYISIDKSDSDIVASYADSFVWPNGEKTVIRHQENLGLRTHILSCGNLLEHYDALIVLEDDVIVSPDFYNYATQCVKRYANDESIAGISLYSFKRNPFCGIPFIPLNTDSDVFLVQMAQSWGQVWMKQQWQEFRKWYDSHNEECLEQSNIPKAISDWPKSSWLKYHDKYCVEQNKYFVYPYVARSTCFADAGTHVRESNTLCQVPLFWGQAQEINISPSVRYDVFLEPEGLGQSLDVKDEELCVDYFGLKQNRENRRYLLTRELLPYKCIKSFGLQLRPWEMNIIMNIPGNQIFLYDTEVQDCEPQKRTSNRSDFSYIYGIHYGKLDLMALNIKIFLKRIAHRQ